MFNVDWIADNVYDRVGAEGVGGVSRGDRPVGRGGSKGWPGGAVAIKQPVSPVVPLCPPTPSQMKLFAR